MNNPITGFFLRTVFRLTPRKTASRQALRFGTIYTRLAEEISPEAGRTVVEVPRMAGVDTDMTHWSYFMLLEHNAIVNQRITHLVQHLASGGQPASLPAVDPKRDVLPSPSAGPEQIENFSNSVRRHIEAVRLLGRLRGSAHYPHPLFGPFDAHLWHCMFGFHLRIHLRQARMIRGPMA